ADGSDKTTREQQSPSRNQTSRSHRQRPPMASWLCYQAGIIGRGGDLCNSSLNSELMGKLTPWARLLLEIAMLTTRGLGVRILACVFPLVLNTLFAKTSRLRLTRGSAWVDRRSILPSRRRSRTWRRS